MGMTKSTDGLKRYLHSKTQLEMLMNWLCVLTISD